MYFTSDQILSGGPVRRNEETTIIIIMRYEHFPEPLGPIITFRFGPSKNSVSPYCMKFTNLSLKKKFFYLISSLGIASSVLLSEYINKYIELEDFIRSPHIVRAYKY